MKYDAHIKQKIEAAACAYLKKPSDETAAKVVNISLDYVIGMLTKGKSSIIEEDEMQEIRLGIYEALQRFNPDKGKFTTWVLWWARRRFYRYKGRDYLSTPQTIREMLMYINKHSGDDISVESLSRKFKCSKNTASSALALLEIKRLDMDGFSADTSYDYQYDPAENEGLHVLDSTQTTDNKIFLEKALDSLDDDDRYIIEALYYRNYTVSQLARELEISPREVVLRRDNCLMRMREALEE